MSKVAIFGIIALLLIVALIFLNTPSRNTCLQEEPPTEVIVQKHVPEEIILVEQATPPPQPVKIENINTISSLSDDTQLPADVDRMGEIFNPYPPLLPFVETLSYVGRVSWLTGRAAYLGDYASHYRTSKHFISRSLNGVGNYLSDRVSKGDRFNVLCRDKEIEFHLVLDLSRLKMWVYSLDKEEDERILLKTYRVCAGRLDDKQRSNSLTPFGTFSLGEEIAVYKPGIVGTYKHEPKEMIAMFGVRWIPFHREIANCSSSAKGLGIHGNPWTFDPQADEWVEERHSIGKYESNGCIRLLTEDVEEVFALIVSRPSYIHIVQDFTQANLPGIEKS